MPVLRGSEVARASYELNGNAPVPNPCAANMVLEADKKIEEERREREEKMRKVRAFSSLRLSAAANESGHSRVAVLHAAARLLPRQPAHLLGSHRSRPNVPQMMGLQSLEDEEKEAKKAAKKAKALAKKKAAAAKVRCTATHRNHRRREHSVCSRRLSASRCQCYEQ